MSTVAAGHFTQAFGKAKGATNSQLMVSWAAAAATHNTLQSIHSASIGAIEGITVVEGLHRVVA